MTVIIGMSKLSEAGTVAIGSIPFSLANESKKTVDTSSLTLQFHKLFRRKGLESLKFNPSGPVAATEVKVSLTENGPLDYVSYQARAIDPGVGLNINEPFYAYETKLNVDAPLTSKEGRSGVVTLTAYYSLSFMATVTARDVGTANYPIQIAVTQADSMNDVMAFAEKNYIDKQISELRGQLGFLKYLAGLLFRREERRLMLAYETTEKFPVGENQAVEFAPAPKQVGRIAYNLLSWDRLVR